MLAPLETLLKNPAKPLPAALRGPIAMAHHQAGRLNELVNRILDLTRLQDGRLPVQPTSTAIAPFLRRVVEQFAPLAAARSLGLHGPESLPDELHLLVDSDKVEQILTNLLINALNHTPVGGIVTMTAALPGPDGYYALTVRDTGPGIAPVEQERVFERFYQSPQNQAQGGTGLGLALSRELATLLGGTLTLASKLGQGAAFTLRFPAEVVVESIEESEDRREEDSKAQSQLNKNVAPPELTADLIAHTPPRPRVLVVEDEPDLRRYLQELLSPAYEVLTATDGQDALELLAREAPVDLITTDAMMPRLSGTELLTRLKADSARAGLPVLMLTARADEGHRLEALTVGVDDYLTKPFAPAELLTRVQTLLVRHAVRRQFTSLPEDGLNENGTTPIATVVVPVAPETEAAAVATEPLAPSAGTSNQLAQWQTQAAGHLSNEQFGPVELARLLGLSERTLYRRLGELAGLTPAAWLRELRLHQARQLLEAGGFGTVTAVSDAVGFASAKHFSNLYAERFGRRPSDYRAAPA
ncbi:response regulator [Hymenobacter sp. J193]|uniref:hybrid sensor histidine kinase/response regulator transcription factor n=1 Tax=Hymenobacter sp. J193 TaxID=2898429 RepID=UPI0021517AB7|nr:response regulator [Hymenobacter sp. J193]MCR5888647.1 response regulator [Hymenobacter sp. J193]